MPYLALYSGGSLHGRWERLIVLPAAIIFYDPATGIREEYQRTTPALTSPACYQLKGTITAVAADSYIRPDDRVEITGPIDTDNPPPAGMQGTVTDVTRSPSPATVSSVVTLATLDRRPSMHGTGRSRAEWLQAAPVPERYSCRAPARRENW